MSADDDAERGSESADDGDGFVPLPGDLTGPVEPIVTDRGTRLLVPTTNGESLVSAALGTWECLSCGTETETLEGEGGEVEIPQQCPSCETKAPFAHKYIPEDRDQRLVVNTAAAANQMWYAPSGVSFDGYDELWGDVREYIRDHWDAGTGDDAEAMYDGLTAYALTTWVRENLTFVPHLMLMGHTTGGKTRLLNTLARVSYRAMVVASATPSSMFRLVDKFNVSYYVSEYHGLEYDAQRELDNIVRAGQKRGELVTRSSQTADGYRPDSYDPFTHAAVATQYEPDDDIVNRCVQVHSGTATRDMPPTHDEQRGEAIRNRLLGARYRLLDPDAGYGDAHSEAENEWEALEADAYDYLAERGIDGRTREKLLSLVAVAIHWDRLDAFEAFVDIVVEQDQGAAADSEDALFVESLRDLAFDQIAETAVDADADPFAALEIPYGRIAARYEEISGVEKSASWVGHVVKRLGFDKKRKRDGTVVHDADLRPKLQRLCRDLNLSWERLEGEKVVERDEWHRAECPDCGEKQRLTHKDTVTDEPLCEQCGADRRREYRDRSPAGSSAE